MATFPLPQVPFFPAGFAPSFLNWDQWWYDAASFFQTGIVFRGRQTTTATTLPSSGAFTQVNLDTVDEDPYGGWDSVNHRWGPPAGYFGYFAVSIAISCTATGAATNLVAGFNGANILAAADLSELEMPGHNAIANGSFLTYMNQSSYIYPQGRILNSAANEPTILTAGQQSFMKIVWCGL